MNTTPPAANLENGRTIAAAMRNALTIDPGMICHLTPPSSRDLVAWIDHLEAARNTASPPAPAEPSVTVRGQQGVAALRRLARKAKALDRTEAELETLRAEFQKFLERAATCQSRNTDRWMRYFAGHINDAACLLQLSSRVRLVMTPTDTHIEIEHTEPAEA